jgi:hypothetical protein
MVALPEYLTARTFASSLVSEGPVLEGKAQKEKKQTASKNAPEEAPQHIDVETGHSAGGANDMERDQGATGAPTQCSAKDTDVKPKEVTSSTVPPLGSTNPHGQQLLEDAYGAEDGATMNMHTKPSTGDCAVEKEVAGVETRMGAGGREEEGMVSLVLTVVLPSSCYATMLLRELLKGTTATSAHKQAYSDAGGMIEDLPGPPDIDGQESEHAQCVACDI